MQVRIGVQSVLKEIVFETSLSVEEVRQALETALSSPQGIFEVLGEKGGRVLVPAAHIGYVEVDDPEGRQIGFGSSF